MKATLYICVALFTLLGCSRPSAQSMLTTAEALAETHPDSALALLDEYLFPEQLPIAERAMYARLWAKTCFDTNKSFVQDTLLDEAIRFYISQSDSLHVLECCRLAGQQQKLKNDNPKGLEYFLQAESYLPSNDDSLRLTFYRLIMQQALDAHQYETSRKYARKMLRFNSIQWQIFALYHIGISFSWENNPDSSFYYSEKSLALAEAHPDRFLPDYLRNVSGNHHLSKDESLRRLRKSMQLSGESSNHLLGIAYTFMRERQLDSAACYLQKAEKKYALEWSSRGREYVTIRNEMAQLRACLQYARGEKDFKQPIGSFNDSLFFSGRNSLKAWEEQSVLQARRAKRDLYFQKQQQHIQLVFVSSLFILIGAVAGIVFYIRHKRNRLIEAEERVEALQQLLNDAMQAAPEGKPDELFFKKILLQQLGIIRLIATAPTEHNRELLQQMVRISNQEVPVDSMLIWSDLYPIIDSAYNGFYSKLNAHYGKMLNEKEVQLCCLLCAGFSTKEISVVSRQSPRTVYQRKTDIRRKLGMEEKEDIVNFIRSGSE